MSGLQGVRIVEQEKTNVELERALKRLESNVVAFVPRSRQARPAQLSDDELIQLRAMLGEFALIKQSCPMARRLLEGE